MFGSYLDHLFYRVVFTVLFMVAGSARAELTSSNLDTFDSEPPIIQDLLISANSLVSNDDAEATWKAAGVYYCKYLIQNEFSLKS